MSVYLYDTDALNRTSWVENSGFQHITAWYLTGRPY